MFLLQTPKNTMMTWIGGTPWKAGLPHTMFDNKSRDKNLQVFIATFSACAITSKVSLHLMTPVEEI